MGIRENLLAVQQKIDRAKENASDPKREVLLIGVTKEISVDRIQEAIQGGLREVGENRIQEARGKVPRLKDVRWHLIGHLQRNKAKEAIQLFDMIHSVDSLRLAETLEKEGSRVGKEVPILLEVNLQGETTQVHGASRDEISLLAEKIASFEHLKLSGLMTLAPFSEDPEHSRPYFRGLRELKEALEKEGDSRMEMRYLSMGMSQDFEVAIEEGANMVRIGRAIFGERNRCDESDVSASSAAATWGKRFCQGSLSIALSPKTRSPSEKPCPQDGTI